METIRNEREFSGVARLKINIQKSMIFIYMQITRNQKILLEEKMQLQQHQK